MASHAVLTPDMGFPEPPSEYPLVVRTIGAKGAFLLNGLAQSASHSQHSPSESCVLSLRR